ncbi:C/D box methylation guide ribonucleoprotein complex aNOP56 subunit [Candidatus Bathyarchaeota archaeon]|nr:C/D box methylation guide ribonucleoprotein complex aNOP56 subunit [Candidatus Bathyarchaeota archaeon]
MKTTIVVCVMGVFGFGEVNKIIDVVLFPKDSKEIANILDKIETGSIIGELNALIKNLQNKGYGVFIFENSRLAKRVSEKLSINVDVVIPSESGEILRGNLDKYALDVGFVKHSDEIYDWVHNVSMELAKIKVRNAAKKRDLLIIQAIQTIDELDKTLNLFVSRVREWHGLSFPELYRLVEKHEMRISLINNLGRRENFVFENLKREGVSLKKAEQIAKIAQASMGVKLDDDDIDQIQKLCKSMLVLYTVRHSLERYVNTMMEDIAPNICVLAGPLLGGRLIALAGGLTNLAKMPASTVQVLGAEKALFRALRSGARPPKHGIIFQHSLLHDSKRGQRGKVARALAGKLTIAARVDGFSGRYIGDKLKEDLKRRIDEIKEDKKLRLLKEKNHVRKS